ncbi:MAG: PRC-barrel domain-containing protein [Desulfosarcinaceae bacterium]|jgi:sporulation protein YlmC with PRC-barrel domain
MYTRTRVVIAAWLLTALLLTSVDVKAAEPGIDKKILASRIIDQDVYDKNNQLIGEVDDIIFRRNGKAKRMTVEFGGILDIGDKVVALPIDSVTVGGEKVTLTLTEAALKKKPTFDYNEHGLRRDYYYRQRPMPGYMMGPGFNTDRPFGPGPFGYPQNDMPGHHRYFDDRYNNGSPMSMSGRWAFSPARFLGSSVIGRRMMNEAGEEIGQVSDLVLAPDTDTIKTIIVTRLDMASQPVRFALPYKPISFTPYGMVYDISLKALSSYQLSEK